WARYGNHALDAEASGLVQDHCREHDGLEPVAATWDGDPLVLEGGALDTNGQGTVLATEECLLDSEVQVRNPGLDRQGYEAALDKYLGARKVVWLGRGIVGDDTHGHVDDVCRFVGPSILVLCQEANPADENYRSLEENRERLESARTAQGERIEVIGLPMPAPLYFEGQRLPASYANFFIGQSCVLVPTFNDPSDRQALGILGECFPGREVRGVHCVDLILGLGALHCLTKEQALV
ncbi:MAG: agmatine deiminase family protein, partial [Desulfovibrio sp.]